MNIVAETSQSDKRLFKNVDIKESNSLVDTTIHYLSPVTLTATSLHAEDDRSQYPCFSDFYRYMRAQHSGYSGEYSFYSDRSSETIELPALERTLAIIRPDAVYFQDVVYRKILSNGFQILQKRKLHLSPEQVSDLYVQYYGDTSFPYLVVTMSSAPVIVMCLAAVGAVKKWKDLVQSTGSLDRSWFFPKSMKRRFGCYFSLDNVLHASEDLASANKEIRYFFPQMILEPLLRYEPEVTDYLSFYVNPTLLDALTELCKRKPIEPILFFADWLLLHNPYQPDMKPEVARLPT